MAEIEAFFFDSYAFFEIIEGNPNYQKYAKVGIVTTDLNLMELHYGHLISYGKDSAEFFFKRFKQFSIIIKDEDIIQANVFRSENKKKKMSYVDCIGYILAKKLNIRFLTGDKAFKDLDNVEFVK